MSLCPSASHCHSKKVLHLPRQYTLWFTIEVPYILQLSWNSYMVGKNGPKTPISKQSLKKPNACEVVVHNDTMAFLLIALHQLHYNVLYQQWLTFLYWCNVPMNTISTTINVKIINVTKLQICQTSHLYAPFLCF